MKKEKGERREFENKKGERKEENEKGKRREFVLLPF